MYPDYAVLDFKLLLNSEICKVDLRQGLPFLRHGDFLGLTIVAIPVTEIAIWRLGDRFSEPWTTSTLDACTCSRAHYDYAP